MKQFLSLPHYDNLKDSHPNTYYHLVKNADQTFRNEIHDIYFGKVFHYKHQKRNKIYGNAMGLEATDIQIDNLFRLKDEFGLEPSLALNSIETPIELLDDKNIIEQLIDFIGELYNRGLRSCIFASTHLIRSGILHKNFPEMRWKTTVNQKCGDAQSVLDMLLIGYDTIMLDRRLNRDIRELRRIKKAVDFYNETYKPTKKALTCLLITEGCVYNCPFKKEHDAVSEYISGNYFRGLSSITCDNWRKPPYSELPRNGIDLVAVTSDTWYEFYNLVDIFKMSGRFTKIPLLQEDDLKKSKLGWLYFDHLANANRYQQALTLAGTTIYSDNWDNIINHNLVPVSKWQLGWINTNLVERDYTAHMDWFKNYSGVWSTDAGKKLEKVLKNCKSQCWDCHECEKTFQIEPYDSVMVL